MTPANLTAAGDRVPPTTGTSGTTTETIADAFTRTAREHASREAISDGVTTLRYAELDAVTNQLGHVLQEWVPRPGARVGVHLERSLATYEVFLGALKAGLVVVPFNPDHPGRHKSSMHRAADPAVTVTDSTAAGLPAAGLLPLADLLAAAASRPTEPPHVEVGAESPAFILFTSGSTGVPKGVVIAHRGIARVSRHLAGFRPGPEDRFLQLAQPSFAASTTDIWTCLLRGGRLRIPPQQVPPLSQLARLVAYERITVLNLPSGLFNRLVDHHPEAVARAASVIVSGDFPSLPHLERALERAGGDLFNAFGCTENSAITAVHKVTTADLSRGEVPVGRPMPTVEMTVRDEDLDECPPGQVGELCLAGDGLAVGYLDDPELTERTFVRRGTGRLLRTGDLARRTEDGEVVLAGRTDQLLKIRGFRVEPRHVELTAETLSGVERAVVQARPSGGAAEQLVLWCTLVPGHRVSERDLLSHLRERLPDYLVPSTATVLDSFPLNANGKIDRQQLAARSTDRERHAAAGDEANRTDAASRTPRDQLAELVRSTLVDVTSDPRIGLDDALLDAGVTSLHLIDLGARLEDLTGVALGPDEIVEAGTARGVAALVRSRRSGRGGSDA